MLDGRLERFGLDNNNSIRSRFTSLPPCRGVARTRALAHTRPWKLSRNRKREYPSSFLPSLAGIQRDSISRVDDPFMKNNEKKETIVLRVLCFAFFKMAEEIFSRFLVGKFFSTKVCKNFYIEVYIVDIVGGVVNAIGYESTIVYLIRFQFGIESKIVLQPVRRM